MIFKAFEICYFFVLFLLTMRTKKANLILQNVYIELVDIIDCAPNFRGIL